MKTVVFRGLLAMTLVALVGGVSVGQAATGAAGGEPDAVGAAQEKARHAAAVEANKRKFPIPIPPASELRSLLKKQKAWGDTTPSRQDEPTDSVPQMLHRYGSVIDSASSTCDRAIPTRQEFLNMLRRDPAQANQILRSCNLNLENVSPLPQLPVGKRQLPEDTRQRPVGTWGR